MQHTVPLAVAAVSIAMLAAPAIGRAGSLDNGVLSARFEDGALVRLALAGGGQIELAGESGSITIDGKTLAVPGLKRLDEQTTPDSVTFIYDAGEGRRLRVVYELKPAWHFIAKRLVLILPAGQEVKLDAVEAMRAQLTAAVAGEHKIADGSRGVFLRLADGQAGTEPRFGAFLVLQNPFMKWQRKDKHISMAYLPEMAWRADWGPFESDRACIGLHTMSGVRLPLRGPGEWKYVADPAKAFEGKPALDWAETDSLTRCVQAFVIRPPARSVRVHIPWCENDYQIDLATPEGRTEYKRIIDQAAAVGCQHVLFTPENSAVAQRKDNADAWGWENCLWLGLGQKIRRGEWDPAKDPIPPTVQEMLDYAKSKNVQLMAYAYPSLGFKQNPEWTQWCQGKTGGYVGADTGVRSFQDWFVGQLVAFQKRTGISGYSFDHWWIAYEAKDKLTPTSKYAQWYGCRRILEELRRLVPEVVIDGRQQYQWFGPWTWLAGTYPHPTTNDEQPGSFQNFPDLHFDRCSGDRQRWASWYYRMEQFTPLDLVPGYMTHQTPRNDAKDQCIRGQAFRTRDWDLLGWRYSVLSSIGTAPFNHVVDMLPARDEAEFKNFSPEDQRWLRGWMDWTDRNAQVLRRLRPIIGPPMLGRVDGTAAVLGDRGFVFLFNPNYRELAASFALDATIGLAEGGPFMLRELYPRQGRLLGKPATGAWNLGDRVELPIKGPQAMVLEIVPVAQLQLPALLNATGQAKLEGDRLVLTDVAGEAGTKANLAVLLPKGATVKSIRVNGADRDGMTRQQDAVSLPVAFAGAAFAHCQQVGTYDPAFAGRTYSAEFTIPQRVPAQLAQRAKSWPIPYTPDDLLCTWLGSDRLLLYVHIAEASDKMEVGMTIDGKPVEVRKAYSAIYPVARERTFVGFYADVSSLQADVKHKVELMLSTLQPGQFQGLFFENVEAEFTTTMVP